MKKKYSICLILVVVCMVALGVTIYTKSANNTKNANVTEYEYGEETYYIYEEDMDLGTELNPSSENYTPTEN